MGAPGVSKLVSLRTDGDVAVITSTIRRQRLRNGVPLPAALLAQLDRLAGSWA